MDDISKFSLVIIKPFAIHNKRSSRKKKILSHHQTQLKLLVEENREGKNEPESSLERRNENYVALLEEKVIRFAGKRRL